MRFSFSGPLLLAVIIWASFGAARAYASDSPVSKIAGTNLGDRGARAAPSAAEIPILSFDEMAGFDLMI